MFSRSQVMVMVRVKVQQYGMGLSAVELFYVFTRKDSIINGNVPHNDYTRQKYRRAQ